MKVKRFVFKVLNGIVQLGFFKFLDMFVLVEKENRKRVLF